MRLLEQLLQLLFPPKCVVCRGLLEKEESDLCHSCRTDLPQFHGEPKGLRYVKKAAAVWYYEDDVRKSLLRYKFRGQRSYSGCYGRMIAMKASQVFAQDIDVVTWVPLSSRRLRKRGYDQVELLARSVSAELEIPHERLLVKKRDNLTQSSLKTAYERRANVLGAYQVCGKETISGAGILLLDDIITTGATVSECARVLREAGAKCVYCAAVAAGRNQKQ
jgi:ComF family protein